LPAILGAKRIQFYNNLIETFDAFSGEVAGGACGIDMRLFRRSR
jgi:hypothetical protein